MASSRVPPLVVVTGDALWDHHIYKGERMRPRDLTLAGMTPVIF